jgi:hypothetical protein
MNRSRITKLVVTAGCAAALALAAGAPPAGAAVGRAAPSERFCTAFNDYYAASFTAALAVGFAEAFGEDAEGADPDEVRGTLLLVLSPRLEEVTGQLSSSAPKVLRPVFRAQRKSFAKGVAVLEDLGFTTDQLDQLASLSTDVDSAELEGSIGQDIDKAELLAAGKDYASTVDDLDAAAFGNARSAFQRAGSQCGLFPNTSFDCEKLVKPAEADALLEDATRTDDEGCEYEGPEPDTGLQPALAVDVYESARAFERLTEKAQQGQTESVPGVGDDAVASEGYTPFTGFKTCGRTLIAKDGERTVVVAFCPPGDTDVANETLTDVATKVLDRI